MDLLTVVSSPTFTPLGGRIFVELLPLAVSDSLYLPDHVGGSTGKIIQWKNGSLPPGTTIIFNKEAAIIPEIDRPWDSHTVVILYEDAIYAYVIQHGDSEFVMPFENHVFIKEDDAQYSTLDINKMYHFNAQDSAHRFIIRSYPPHLSSAIPHDTKYVYVCPRDVVMITYMSEIILCTNFENILYCETV